MAHVLIIEDEAVLARCIARSLTNLGLAVTVTRTLAEGEQVFTEECPDLLLLDMELPDGNGLDLLASLIARDPEVRILVMTAYAGPQHAARALELGARACLHKPMDLEVLASAVRGILADDKPLEQRVRL